MADDDILSELERFEQEMKELVSDSQPSYETQASVVSALATPALATEISNISTAQQSPSISAAPLVGPSTYVPPKPVIATAASTHVQSQISAAPAPASSSQWLNNGIGHTPVALPAVTPAATSTSTPFSYSSQYPQQPFTVPQYTAQVPKQYPAAPQPSLSAVHTPVYPYTSMYQPTVGVGGIYSLPQQQQAQQLFQKDAQTITPEALESVKAALASSESEHKADTKKKAIPRKAAGQSWEDPTLAEWPENDFRLFCGDLGNEVNDEVLTKAFSRFPTFNMARVVRDKRTGKTKGYGFVSFSNPSDLANALKEMNGKYVGNRPIKLRKSNWKERTDYEALTKHKHKKAKHSKKHMPNR